MQGKRIDPITHTPYQYQPGQGSQYSLSATFSRESQTSDTNQALYPASEAWDHPAGNHCFAWDSATQIPYPMQ